MGGKHQGDDFRKHLLSSRTDLQTSELGRETLKTPMLRPPRRATAQLQVWEVHREAGA